MKLVILVRHATAVDRAEDLPDFERSLRKKGKKESKSVADKLRKQGIVAERMVSSPANRAIQTAHIFAEEMEYPVQNIDIVEALYDGMATDVFVEYLHQLDDSIQTVVFFGHNPAFDDFAAALLNRSDLSLPKCGAAGIRFRSRKWQTVAAGKGKLQFFEYPKGKFARRMRQDFEQTLAENFSRKLFDVLNEMQVERTPKSDKLVINHSTRLAAELSKKVPTPVPAEEPSTTTAAAPASENSAKAG